MDNRPIGIFDSGLGGISVLNECINLLPNESFIYYGDSANAPYGEKDRDFIVDCCKRVCDFLIKKDVKAIIVACNTATSAAIDILRAHYDIPIIGMEPALKLAVHNKPHQNVLVLATEFTLKEKKFASLMKDYQEEHTIIKGACPDFVDIVEQDKVSQEAVNKQLDRLKTKWADIALDSVVLGCTHFVFLKNEIMTYFQNETIKLIDGNEGTVNNLKHILEIGDLRANQKQTLQIYNSDNCMIEVGSKLIKKAI